MWGGLPLRLVCSESVKAVLPVITVTNQGIHIRFKVEFGAPGGLRG